MAGGSPPAPVLKGAKPNVRSSHNQVRELPSAKAPQDVMAYDEGVPFGSSLNMEW